MDTNERPSSSGQVIGQFGGISGESKPLVPKIYGGGRLSKLDSETLLLKQLKATMLLT
jgi:hypothetical protein